ncbi:MAG TPA: excisionase family DNA-binding protein [Candidatus Acidoferrum sp.]|nr:excisionase family DNA-binding protein [Candidatus Acidoferrum sp.]
MHRDDNKLEAMLERVLRKMLASQQSGWMTIPEAAAYMKCTKNYAQCACTTRKIPFYVVGNRYLLNREDCDAHVKSHSIPAKNPAEPA